MQSKQMSARLGDRPALHEARPDKSQRYGKIVRSFVQQGTAFGTGPAVAGGKQDTHTTGAPKSHALDLERLREKEFAGRAKGWILGLNEFAEERLPSEVALDEVDLPLVGEQGLFAQIKDVPARGVRQNGHEMEIVMSGRGGIVDKQLAAGLSIGEPLQRDGNRFRQHPDHGTGRSRERGSLGSESGARIFVRFGQAD